MFAVSSERSSDADAPCGSIWIAFQPFTLAPQQEAAIEMEATLHSGCLSPASTMSWGPEGITYSVFGIRRHAEFTLNVEIALVATKTSWLRSMRALLDPIRRVDTLVCSKTAPFRKRTSLAWTRPVAPTMGTSSRARSSRALAWKNEAYCHRTASRIPERNPRRRPAPPGCAVSFQVRRRAARYIDPDPAAVPRSLRHPWSRWSRRDARHTTW